MGTNIKLAGAVGVSSSAPNTSQVTFSVTTATFDLSAGGFTLRLLGLVRRRQDLVIWGMRGSICFYSLVPNSVPVTGSGQPLDAGTCQMTVTSRPSRSFPAGVSCTLINTPPVLNGPANEVTATCATPAGTGTAANAVVAVSKA